MLVEVWCDKFISNGKVRKPIRFHAGLNAVLGDDNGSNSIGKSTFLMILDFVFGGTDYVKKCVDVQENVKEHTICFAFDFDGQNYYFSRNTVDYNKVVQCDSEYQALPDGEPLSFKNMENSYVKNTVYQLKGLPGVVQLQDLSVFTKETPWTRNAHYVPQKMRLLPMQ